MKRKKNRTLTQLLTMLLVLSLLLTGCGPAGSPGKETENPQVGGQTAEASKPGETILLRVLENDTAKSEGYLQELLDAFNAAYADKGIQAVDANMDEYTDLATNGPYGYGPDVLYQANDKLMTYAGDRHILPLEIQNYDCYDQIPEAAWKAFQLTVDGKTYCCGIPVNIQEPMLFYRADRMPEDCRNDSGAEGNGCYE